MLSKSILGLSLTACFTLPTWADTTQWGRWSTIRFPAHVNEMLATGFYAHTPSGSDVYIRQDQRVLRDGQLVNPAFLRLGDNIQVVVPAGQGQIRYRDDDVAVLSTPQGLAQVPEANLQLAYQNPYASTAQPARSSSSNYYLSSPRSADSYSSENFYVPTSSSYYPTPYQPYAYNYSNPNGSFNWEGAAVSLLGTVLANTLSPNNYNNAYNPYIGYSQGNYDYSSSYNQTYRPYAYNQGYPAPGIGANNFQPRFQVSNWIPNNTWVGSYRPQVQMNSWNRDNYRIKNNHSQGGGKSWKQKTAGAKYYRPQVQVNSWNRNNYRVYNQRPQVRTNKWNRNDFRVNKGPKVRMNSYQQPGSSNHARRTQINYSRPQYQPQQNFHGGGGGFRSAPQQRNFNPGGGHGGGHHGGGSHGKGRK